MDITAMSDTDAIQDYLQQLTGARTVSLGFCSQRLGAPRFLFLVRAVKGYGCLSLGHR